MPAIYQLYIQSGITGELTQGRWFVKQGEAIGYARGFHFRHPDQTVIVCRETFLVETDPKPNEIIEVWRRDGKPHQGNTKAR